MGPLSTVLIPDTLRSIAASTFTGSYQAIGSALAQSVRIIKFTNATSQTCTISWDGVHAHEILPPNSFVLLDVSAARENAQYFEIQQGTQFFVEASSGTGTLYISCYYGK